MPLDKQIYIKLVQKIRKLNVLSKNPNICYTNQHKSQRINNNKQYFRKRCKVYEIIESRGNVLPLERRRKIVELVSANHSVKVIDLSKEFDVTEETIRRDLEKLEREKVLVRTYGGAVLTEKTSDDEPFSIRSRENIDRKKSIGQAISDIIQDGDVIMMDSSTTSLEVAKVIGDSKNITLITNSMGLAMEMVQYDKIQVICSGGTLRRRALSFIGPVTKQSIQNYYADKVILSCKGINMEKGIMESNEMESEVKNAMINTARTVILAVDHTKFDNLAMVRSFDFSKVDMVVTDAKPSKKWLKYFEKMEIECLGYM